VISTEGLLTVTEAAKRLNRSTEQVRRYLREGKLKGQRIGNQWFVEQAALTPREEDDRLIPKELGRNRPDPGGDIQANGDRL
jgi:excisionase family DNA binding protein